MHKKKKEEANAIDFNMTSAQRLVRVNEMLKSDAWKEAQKKLRKSSYLLKQDLYTIIQAKPGNSKASPDEILYQSVQQCNRTRLRGVGRGCDTCPRVL